MLPAARAAAIWPAKAAKPGASPAEMQAFFHAYLDGSVAEYQMAAFAMAVYFQGLDDDELATLVDLMLGSGATLDLGHLNGPRIDKHSTGGVGDKVSLVLAPLAAELGIYVPMMSGRGLGHTGGTLDKLEAIPGFRTDLTLERFQSVLSEVGCAMIGQTEEIAPGHWRVTISSDGLYPPGEVADLAAGLRRGELVELDVPHGHDSFLIEMEQINRHLADFITRHGLKPPLELAVGE